ncbi:MAG: peptidase E [Chloroflexota bacterium]
MTTQQIIALGGGGFSMEPDNLALDRYILEQTNRPDPAVAFLPTASGDNADYIVRFYTAFRNLGCYPSHLSLFQPHTADIEGYIMEQDVIYVGGGNTRSMLALWREWELDMILRDALEQGVILAGLSAGAICWFQAGTTDSIPGGLTVIPGMGLLPYSCSPHHDGEPRRRPAYEKFVGNGDLPAGYAMDDSAGVHFIDGALHRCVASQRGARVSFITPDQEGGVTETAQVMTHLAPYRP